MSTEATAAPKTIFVEGFTDDPYPTYKKFLSEGPIHLLAIGPGLQSVFSYSLVSSLLKDSRLSAKRAGAYMQTVPEDQRPNFAPLVKTHGLWMLFMDAPEHSRLRKLLNKGFSPAVAESLRPRIDAIVEKMFEAFDGKTEAEIMTSLAHPLPAKVIAEMLGIPASMDKDLMRWSEAIAIFMGNPRRTVEQCYAAQDAVMGLTDFFRIAVAERRGERGTDLISLLLTIEEDGETLTEDELYAQCVMLLFAGHETTRNLIGNGLFTLLQHPEELARLRENPNLVRSGIEELLRYQSPVQFATRLAKEEFDVEGVKIQPGQQIMLMLGAANRDPNQFKNPDTLDLARSNNAHLAFGAGAHFCIGNQIARLEAQSAILKLLQRFPKLRFAEQVPKWNANPVFRGFQSLPVNLQ